MYNIYIMNRILDKIKILVKDRKKVVLLFVVLFLLLGLSFTVLYLTNRDSSFDSRSRASSTPSLGSENVNGDLNDDGKVSMEDFRLWLGFYRGYKGSNNIRFKSIGTGGWHTCGMGSDDNGYCWGNNYSGQLGYGNTGTDSNVPVLVSQGDRSSGVTFVSISAGGSHTCGVGSDGNGYCWGDNDFGQLGDTGADSNIPKLVGQGERATGVTFVSISAGSDYTCGIGSDGEGYCWGDNRARQLGNGNTGTNSNVPKLVSQGDRSAGVTFVSISAGSSHSCGVGSDGNGYCWGGNVDGQLGNGNTGTTSNVPKLVSQGERPSADITFISISVGSMHTCGIGSNGEGYCWGYNGIGQLGNGNTGTESNVPVLVSQGARTLGVTFGSVSTAGNDHTCGIGSDGNGYCWGYNCIGQLGNGNTGTDSNVPVLVKQGGNREEYKKGDLNKDGKVSMEDFRLWLQAYREYKRKAQILSKGIYWTLDDASLKDSENTFLLASAKDTTEVQPELVTGKKGKAVNFKGVKGYRLEYKNPVHDYLKPSSLTAMAYIKLSGGECGYREHCVILSKGCSGHKGFAFAVKDGKLRLWINDTEPSDTDTQALGNTTLQKDVWYHVAGTYNKSDGSLKVYVNGVLDGSGTNTAPIDYGGASFWIGNANDKSDLQFNGAIDEVRFFNRALTQSEIASFVIP